MDTKYVIRLLILITAVCTFAYINAPIGFRILCIAVVVQGFLSSDDN